MLKWATWIKQSRLGQLVHLWHPEFTLHADAIVAHAEYYAGLPETRVGLLPAWGGCTQMLLRNQLAADQPRGLMAQALRSFNMIMEGSSSTSAWDARAKGLLGRADGVVMNRDHVLAAARKRALELTDNYVPPARASIAVTGHSGKLMLMNEVNSARKAGRLTDTDVMIAEALATVLTGGTAATDRPMSEEELMALEREALVALSATTTTRARIEHMLAAGKPLRN